MTRKLTILNPCLLQIFPSLLWLCGIGGSFLSCALVCGGAIGEYHVYCALSNTHGALLCSYLLPLRAGDSRHGPGAARVHLQEAARGKLNCLTGVLWIGGCWIGCSLCVGLIKFYNGFNFCVARSPGPPCLWIHQRASCPHPWIQPSRQSHPSSLAPERRVHIIVNLPTLVLCRQSW